MVILGVGEVTLWSIVLAELYEHGVSLTDRPNHQQNDQDIVDHPVLTQLTVRSARTLAATSISVEASACLCATHFFASACITTR